MKKILFALPILFLLIIVLFMFDYIYYPLISSKAEKAAEKYLEEKYKEDFVIDSSIYGKQLGEDWGGYDIDAHPAKDPNLNVRIFVFDNMEEISDDYLETKWREDLNEQFSSLYNDLFGPPENYSYMVNVTFPEDITTKYNKTHTYQDIFEREHTKISNSIFAIVFLDRSNEMTKELDKIFTLIQHLKEQQLKRFSIDIEYYDSSFKQKLSDEDNQLDYSDFSKKHFTNRVYVLRFSYDSTNEESKQRLEKIKSAADLKQYLQYEDMN